MRVNTDVGWGVQPFFVDWLFYELSSELSEADVKCISESFFLYQFTRWSSRGCNLGSELADKLAKNVPTEQWYDLKLVGFNTGEKHVFMFHLLQISALFVGFLAYIIDLVKSSLSEVYFPVDGVRLSLCALYNMTHALILLFLLLVLGLVFSVCLSVHPLLEASLGWLSCILETGDEINVREIVIQENLYNF